MDCDVVVAGAGPVGLMLAAELRLAGVSVIVLERLTEQSQAIKAGGINGRSTQAFARRGLRARLEEESARQGEGFAAFSGQPTERAPGTDVRPQGRFDGHFAGLFLEARPDFDVPPSTVLPQQALERLLEAWVTELGVPIRRGHLVTALDQDADAVTVRAMTTDGELSVRGRYLVGCDGGRSAVRRLAGFDFPGTDPLTTGYQAIVDFDDPQRLPLGWHLTEVGLCAHGPKPGRLLTVSFDGPPADRDAPITVAELQDNVRRISGTDVTITSITASTRYTDNTRQATTYRAGRVLLAGDAAHVHPPFGGQGLNLGLQDAVNLGWKLAATVQGWAPEGLLDTYTTERHPVGARVLENTRAQIAIMRPDPHSRAVRDVLSGLIQDPGTTERLVSMLQGLDICYDLGPAYHPLTGRHVPDLPGVEAAMRPGRPVLFDRTDSAGLRAAADAWTDRVDVCGLPRSTEPAALLVRPDGYVVWATDSEPDPSALEELHRALLRWLGKPKGPSVMA